MTEPLENEPSEPLAIMSTLIRRTGDKSSFQLSVFSFPLFAIRSFPNGRHFPSDLLSLPPSLQGP